MKKAVLFCLISFFICLKAVLPEGFVYLEDVDPSIQQTMRYATKENFVGRVIPGYKEGRAILTKEAAEALHRVQQNLLKKGYSLVVYEAYRPQQAVDSFVEWAEDIEDQGMKKRYYPDVDKRKVFDLGYIDARSGHSRGSTVDLTIIKLGKEIREPHEIIFSTRQLTDGRKIEYMDDGTVDMGSSFDLFDEASHHDTSLVAKEYIELRNFFRREMEAEGFKTYKEEWWHYTLVNEPYPDTYFDFVVE